MDVETTGATNATKGNPFCPDNKLCYVGLLWTLGNSHLFDIEYSDHPYGSNLAEIQTIIDDADLLIGFNIKFDLHWLRRYGIKFQHKPIFDLQQGDFIISGQLYPMSSLDECLERRRLEGKSHVVEQDYWNKGIDTDKIPRGILEEYLGQDLKIEANLFNAQLQDICNLPHLKRLIFNCCQDELVTEEMEWNGLYYDVKLSLAKAEELRQDVIRIDKELFELFPNPHISWSSPQNVSAILYGGTIKWIEREEYTFSYKDARKGTRQKLRNVERREVYPRIVEPIKKSGRSVGGQFGTGEKILGKLKAFGSARRVVSLILERRKLEKRIDTYYIGIPKTMEKFKWQNNLIHGTLNHAVAATGRLSSSNPNQQNMDELIRACIQSRFKS